MNIENNIKPFTFTSNNDVSITAASQASKSTAIQTQLNYLKNENLRSKINRLFWIGLGCWSTYNLIDAGLSRFLVLETLTHGTGPLGYIGINLTGADPNYGGGNTGSSVGGGFDFHIKNSKNFFHVFKDSEFSFGCNKDIFSSLACNVLIKNMLPRMHSVLSGMANFGYSNANNKGNFVTGTLGAAAGLFTPTLKFRFLPQEVLNCNTPCFFENDPFYYKSAYRTSNAISPFRLGITGSLLYGINTNLPNRMCENPLKVINGIILLGTAILIAKKTSSYAKSTTESKPEAVKATETESNVPSETFSYFQNCKKTIRPIAVKSGWASLALSIIFLNTL